MKRWFLKACKRTVAAGVGIISLSISSQTVNAGFLDMLRGDSIEPSFQRVAFIGSAKVKRVNGEVEQLTGVDRWNLLSDGGTLRPGDVIRTRAGTVLLEMRESGSFVKVTPHTVLRLIKMDDEWDRSALSGREERDGFAVRSCRGKAYFDAGEGRWQMVKVKAVLPRGTYIRTESGAVVDLFHTEMKRSVRVTGGSQVTLSPELVADRPLVESSLAAASR